MISTDPWIWISALLTICSFTLLYGDNPLFRIAEYTYTGTVVGHSVVTAVPTLYNNFLPLITGEKPLYIIPLMLGIMSVFVVWKKYAWVASFPYAMFIGVGIGLSARATIQTNLVGNMMSVIRESANILIGPPASQLGFLIRVVFTLSGIIYLFLTMFHTGPLSKPVEYIRTFGKYCFLLYLGVQIGNGLMQHSGLTTNALNRVLKQWLGL